eukprot:4810419-Pleurochrysis_carterae.AAC.5
MQQPRTTLAAATPRPRAPSVSSRTHEPVRVGSTRLQSLEHERVRPQLEAAFGLLRRVHVQVALQIERRRLQACTRPGRATRSERGHFPSAIRTIRAGA